MGCAMTLQTFEILRRITLGGTGVICLAYAVLSLIAGRPDPMPFWIPGLAGALAGVVISIGARMNPKSASDAMDEGYRADWGRAQRHAYWVALLLYPLFGLLLALGWVKFHTAFAAMGTLTGAAMLLLFVIYDLQGR